MWCMIVLIISAIRSLSSSLAHARMVKKLEWIEMSQLAVSSIFFKSFSLKLP